MFFRCSLAEDVELRLLQLTNADEFCSLINDNQDHLKPWFSWAWEDADIASVKDYIQNMLRTFADTGGFDSGIWCNGKLIGLVGITHVDKKNRRSELAYWLAEDFVGRGLARLATCAVIDYIFSEMELNRIDIRVDPDNVRSKALIKNLGGVYEGTLRQHIWINNNPVDLEMHSILKDEWESKKCES